MKRRVELNENEYYHVFNKSIAKFIIFNSDEEYQRMMQTIMYYQVVKRNYPLSDFLRLNKNKLTGSINSTFEKNISLVQIITFCLMPTHIHLLLKQNFENGISIYMGNVLNSYARYFNKKHKRKGPLWESRFKAVHVETDEQLWHVSRYIHLNPTTAQLVSKPELWEYSSYVKFTKTSGNDFLPTATNILNCTSKEYQKFVEDQIFYQRELASIKHLTIDE